MMNAVSRAASRVWRPEMAVLLPIFALAAFQTGGEVGLILFSLCLPVTLLLIWRRLPSPLAAAISDQVIDRLDMILRDTMATTRQTGCLVVQFDDPMQLCDRLGRARQSEVLAACVARLRGALRPGDMLFALEDGSLVVALGPTERLDLEVMVRIAGRLQLVVQQPMVLADTTIQMTCCIGFAHARQLDRATGRTLLEAAQVAVDEATRYRPGAIRAFSRTLAEARADRDALRDQFAAAVEAGQVRAHFQPQLSTDTGALSGVEALARWHHPTRGCLMPGDFLPALEGTDLMHSLGEAMLTQSLVALQDWDKSGLWVPSVSINVSAQELRDPQWPDRLAWALERYGLAASRLTVEVLESVVAGPPDDIIVRNIDRIARIGCGVDMDDFGTGNASITSIKCFALRRLKIDRSFIRGIDTNRDQQTLVTAILSLAERLDLDTLAEGVESQAEHALLAQLGCGHVQGYAIARPLPFDEMGPWVARHQARLADALRIGVKAR
ncbi:MAG: GGDEF domain-containing phosphodiesterase [Tabrizicola sp.]|jgi:EAL domain-containing protein (putative c-di-GMP-specific phosphodiesterase class I)|nr:GGDEF domain-containing phosphodiesterase [Tabrizicola sp.]